MVVILCSVATYPTATYMYLVVTVVYFKSLFKCIIGIISCSIICTSTTYISVIAQ